MKSLAFPSNKATYTVADALNNAMQSNVALNRSYASSSKTQPTKKQMVSDQRSNASFKARVRGESLAIGSSVKEKKRLHQANRDAGRVSKKVRTSGGGSLEGHPAAYLLPTPKAESFATQWREYPAQSVTSIPSTREIIDLTTSPSPPIPRSSITPPREASLGSPSITDSKQYRTTKAFNPYASYDKNTERTLLHITDYAPTNSLAISLNIRSLLTHQLPISPHAPLYRADNGLQDAPMKVEGWLCFPEVPSSVPQEKQPFSTGGRIWMKWMEDDGEEEPTFEDHTSQPQESPRAASSIRSISRPTPLPVPLPRPPNPRQLAPCSSHTRTTSSLSTSSFGVANSVIKVNPKRKPLSKNSTLVSYEAQPLASSSRVQPPAVHRNSMDKSPLKKKVGVSVNPLTPSPSQTGTDPPSSSKSRPWSESEPIGDPRLPSSAFVGGSYIFNTVNPSFLSGPTPPPPSTVLSHPSPERPDGIDIRDDSITGSSDDDVPLLLLVDPSRAQSMSAASQGTKGQDSTSWRTPRLSSKAKGKQPARWHESPSPDIDATFEEAALDAVLPFRDLSSGSEYVGSGPKEGWKNRSRSPKKKQVKIVDSNTKAKEKIQGKRTIRQPAKYRDVFVAHDVLRVDVDEGQKEGDKGGRSLARQVSIPRQFSRQGKKKVAENSVEEDDDAHSSSSSSNSGCSSTSQSEDEMVDVETYTAKPKSKQILLSSHKDYQDLPLETLESYCHQCRAKSNKCKLSCEGCKAKFCNRCLVMRCVFQTGVSYIWLNRTAFSYADRTFEMQSHKAPSCPRCDGYCNCTACTAKRGETYVSSKRTSRLTSAPAASSDRVAKSAPRHAQASLSPTSSPRKGRTRGGPRLENVGRSLTTLPTLRLDVPPPDGSIYWGVVYDLDGDKIGSAFMQPRKGKFGEGNRLTRGEVDEEVIYATAQNVEGLQIVGGVLGPPMLPTVPLEEIRKRWIDPQKEERSDKARHAVSEQSSLSALPGNRYSQIPLAPHYIRLEYKRSRTFAGNYQRCWGLKITKASRIKNKVPKVGYVGSRRMLKWKITSEPAQNPDLENDWDEEDAEGEVVDGEEWEEGGQPDNVPLSGNMSPLTDLEELGEHSFRQWHSLVLMDLQRKNFLRIVCRMMTFRARSTLHSRQ